MFIAWIAIWRIGARLRCHSLSWSIPPYRCSGQYWRWYVSTFPTLDSSIFSKDLRAYGAQSLLKKYAHEARVQWSWYRGNCYEIRKRRLARPGDDWIDRRLTRRCWKEQEIQPIRNVPFGKRCWVMGLLATVRWIDTGKQDTEAFMTDHWDFALPRRRLSRLSGIHRQAPFGISCKKKAAGNCRL